MTTIRYDMQDRECPQLMGRHRLGTRPVYQPVIRNYFGVPYLIEELRHPDDPNVPVLGISVIGIVERVVPAAELCFVDTDIDDRPAAARNFAALYPEYRHLLPAP